MVNKLLFIFSFFLLSSCNSHDDFDTSSSELVKFSIENIENVISSKNLDPVRIKWRLDSTLTQQAYSIKVNGNSIQVVGGDEHGLMYGGLEVAEQLKLNGKAINTTHKPYILKRGLKINIPLDARTPSYDDSGDAAIKNVATMWQWEFWKKYLDQMAHNRYNVLSLWNPHPFPSMIKLKEFLDVALEDVYTTSYKPNGKENEMGDPQLVSTVVYENLELVKSITIDDKIAFWQKVMDYAVNRGVDIYWITWNICPNSVATPVEPGYWTYGINMEEEVPGKHGITHQIDNQITIDYHRVAVKQFLLTYPQIKGIGVTAGEHMPKEWVGKNREEWLWETYGLGILDAKKEQPSRIIPFIHRVWHSDMEQIMNVWKDYPDPFDVSFKYAKARLYSSPKVNFYDEHIEQMDSYGLKSWWNLRNDDIFVYRWANVDYVRKFIQNIPKEATKGFYMGSDGYVWGREFISKDIEFSSELEFEKHWMRYMLWGRLAFNPKLSDTHFKKVFQSEHPSDNSELLFETWQIASKIIPQINRFHWRNWDADWSVESCRARAMLGGFRDVFDFIDNPTMKGEDILNPKDYVTVISDNKEISGLTPIIVAQNLRSWANQVIKNCEKLDLDIKDQALADDMVAMSYLGLYYSYKIDAATNLAFYQLNGQQVKKQEAKSKMEQGLHAILKYADISNKRYYPQMLARPGKFDWDEMVKEVEEEIRTISSYNINNSENESK